MNEVKMLDLGALFGLAVGPVFTNSPSVTIITPQSRAAAAEVLMHGKVDLVGFGGGADIHPSLYGCKDVASSVGHGPSERDRFERQAFSFCVERDIPMLGLCRGAQLICALSGGKLVQDVRGHGGMHSLFLHGGGVLPMTSTHHQMMYPWDVNHTMLAWTENRSKVYQHDIPNYVQPDKDPEVVFFPQTRALAVQGHPEWMEPGCATVSMVRSWVSDYLRVNV